MKIFTSEEVRAKIMEFQELLGREKALQDELLSLRLQGDSETVKRNTERHDQIIAQIEEIRFNHMLPIFQEMADFVKECRKIEKELEAKKGKAPQAPEGPKSPESPEGKE